ncbi:MAG TPA: riboflavin synthase [Thermoanaerobaculia bacterium]|nr:riboflavin synthase [Thermoanaerobaculia bacterium]
MFTGIILHTGTIQSYERLANGARLRIRTTDPIPFTRGESLAVNGVCLTVLPETDGSLLADLSDETLSRTTLGTLGTEQNVNVERALAVGDRLGGHMVQGHVDTVGTLVSIAHEGDFAIYRWSCPSEYADLIVAKGSIAVDGVSLTIVDPGNGSFGAALIPETLRRTNIGRANIGDRVNLEFDMIAKHVRMLVMPYLQRIS